MCLYVYLWTGRPFMSIQNSGFIKELQKSKQRKKIKVQMLKPHCLSKFDPCVYTVESVYRMNALNFYLFVYLNSADLIQRW